MTASNQQEVERADEVVTTEVVYCPGRLRRAGRTWLGQDRWEPVHTKKVRAVMLIYRSGRTRIACPECGTYDLETEDEDTDDD